MKRMIGTGLLVAAAAFAAGAAWAQDTVKAVSYTHLTLPTILRV